MQRLAGKVAIITGGGQGIGRAIALLFAAEGARVAVCDIHEESAETTARLCTDTGFAAIAARCDVSVASDVRSMTQVALETFGRIDILVNNAAVRHFGSVTETEEADWDRAMAVNVKGPFLCSRYAIPVMMKGAGGSIVNVSSVAGLTGMWRSASYNASKSAVIMLSKNMALDYAGHGIRVNCLCPGATYGTVVDSGIARSDVDPAVARARMEKLRPLGRLAEPAEIARAALFLASDESSYMTGSVVVVDGGATAQPSGQLRPRD